MGKQFTLTSSDSFKLGAYRADPAGKAKGGIVVIQEIFGVNHHIRAVCDRLAAQGYTAVAPAVFDRQQPNFESGYTPDEIANARKFVANPDWGAMMRDVQASIDELKKKGRLPSRASAWAAASPSWRLASSMACHVPWRSTAATLPKMPTKSQRCRLRCISAKKMPRSR